MGIIGSQISSNGGSENRQPANTYEVNRVDSYTPSVDEELDQAFIDNESKTSDTTVDVGVVRISDGILMSTVSITSTGDAGGTRQVLSATYPAGVILQAGVEYAQVLGATADAQGFFTFRTGQVLGDTEAVVEAGYPMTGPITLPGTAENIVRHTYSTTKALVTGPDYTQRKGSTFTVTHGLGTAPDSVTINALACTIANATSTTVDVTVDAAITTSGEYDMVIEDTVAVTSETQTVQVNVVGLPAYTLNKDGSALGNLTGVKAVVTATGEIDGTELYSANDLTATAGVMDSGIYPATGEDGDAVTVSILTGAGEGITFNDALELL